jgi:DNA-binding transcriptional LysR family regulator
MTRLIRDGFGIGALPAALVGEELKQGLVTVLDDVPQPPALDMVLTWRTGVGLELSEDIVALAGEVLQEYAKQLGDNMITLLPFASDQGIT